MLEDDEQRDWAHAPLLKGRLSNWTWIKPPPSRAIGELLGPRARLLLWWRRLRRGPVRHESTQPRGPYR